jgi:uncharacterized NAD-dependent epimerase/dehydratase family protein
LLHATGLREISPLEIQHPYLMFLGDAPDDLAAKVANGVAAWRPEWCLGQFRLPGCQADLGLPDMDLEEGWRAGCRSVIVGVANRGGIIPENWVDPLIHAVEIGYDIASGLHSKLNDIEPLRERAIQNGRTLYDVRHPTGTFSVASGARRAGKRLLTVGTDCSVGKMFTSLAVEKEMKARGMKASFRATGQTGIFIAGSGVSVDAVVADFISGAAEGLSPANDEAHWDVIEGQGSLFHASFSGVSLGLLHGSQPDALIVCHEPTRDHMRGLPDHRLPSLNDCIAVNERMGRMVNPDCRVIGVSINTSLLPTDRQDEILTEIEAETGLPTVEGFRPGRLVDAL